MDEQYYFKTTHKGESAPRRYVQAAVAADLLMSAFLLHNHHASRMVS
jgi:hypothetical protein